MHLALCRGYLRVVGYVFLWGYIDDHLHKLNPEI